MTAAEEVELSDLKLQLATFKAAEEITKLKVQLKSLKAEHAAEVASLKAAHVGWQRWSRSK